MKSFTSLGALFTQHRALAGRPAIRSSGSLGIDTFYHDPSVPEQPRNFYRPSSDLESGVEQTSFFHLTL
jgi:hypothetical protein